MTTTTPNGHDPVGAGLVRVNSSAISPVNSGGDDVSVLRHRCDRFEWERIVRRLVAPKHVKFLALVLATYADTNGTRVRPGNKRLAAVTGDEARNVRRILQVIRDELGLLEQVSRGGGRGRSEVAAVYRLTIPVDLLERATLLDPDERPSDPEDIWMSGE